MKALRHIRPLIDNDTARTLAYVPLSPLISTMSIPSFMERPRATFIGLNYTLARVAAGSAVSY
jgi:hypothetical protein